jgi:hypothetical protein
MAYIGRDPLYGVFEKQVLAPNGVLTSFNLDYLVGSASSLLVIDDGAILEPGVAFTITNGGRSIQFASAPAGNVYLIYLGKQLLVPKYGRSFIVRDLTDNLTIDASDLPDILSVNPITTNRTVFIPTAVEMAGYQVIVRNRSSTVSVIINAGANITTVTPNSSATIASDGVSWFVVT